ncbi:hypothetical protein AtubIFM57143_001031 [Aspergillus tubingensis]|nr:hypothetical protein AtubIFM57143_001031 [Aspergillus tubingensis]
MFGSGLMSWLRPSEAVPESKWNPETLTMEQPASPSGPSMEHVVTEQPRPGESMQLQIRGGGEGEVCCGICAGVCCFECCECCCDCCGDDGPDGPPPPPGPPGPP